MLAKLVCTGKIIWALVMNIGMCDLVIFQLLQGCGFLHHIGNKNMHV